MAGNLVIGHTISWKWGAGIASGIVEDIQPNRVEIESKGALIARNGTPDNPAVIIRHTSGTLVLKRASELTPS